MSMSKRINLEYFGENTSICDVRVKGASSNGNWASVFFGPAIPTSVEVYEFILSIRLLSNLMIGLMRFDHNKDKHFCQDGECIGWGWGTSGGNSYRYKIGGNDTNPSGLGMFKTGDKIRFMVNKLRKTIHIQRNSEKIFPLYENVEFHDQLHIAISQHKDEMDVELVSFVDIWNTEQERLDSICENLGNFEIPLDSGSKTIKLWTCLLLDSSLSIRDIEKSSSECLVDKNLQVDEKTILGFLLQRTKVKVLPEHLIDYWVLFHFLGLKKQEKEIVDRIKVIGTFRSAYDILMRLCFEGYENQIIMSWYGDENGFRDSLKKIESISSSKEGSSDTPSDVNQITIDTFDTSFGLALFNQMREHYKTEKESNPNFTLTYSRGIQHYLFLYSTAESAIDPVNHSDFQGVNFDELKFEKVIEKLSKEYEFPYPLRNVSISENKDEEMEETEGEEVTTETDEEKKLEDGDGKKRVSASNVKLLSNDEDTIVFPCHLELLFYRSSRFVMLRNHGKDREMYEKKGVIHVEDMNAVVLKAYLGFIYTNKLDHCENVQTLLSLLVRADKYFNFELINSCLNKIDQVVEANALDDLGVLEKLIRNIGHEISVPEGVQRFAVPRLVTWVGGKMDAKKIIKLIHSASHEYFVETQITRINGEIQKFGPMFDEKKYQDLFRLYEEQSTSLNLQQEEIDQQKKEIEKLTEENKDKDMKINELERRVLQIEKILSEISSKTKTVEENLESTLESTTDD